MFFYQILKQDKLLKEGKFYNREITNEDLAEVMVARTEDKFRGMSDKQLAWEEGKFYLAFGVGMFLLALTIAEWLGIIGPIPVLSINPFELLSDLVKSLR